jgi:murein DD-endopeptidase MepM/ murein hydrolase activator NlpD
MKVIFLSNFCKRTSSVDFCVPSVMALAGFAIIGAVSLTFAAGYLLGERSAVAQVTDVETREIRDMLAEERRVIAEVKAEQRAHLDALALKIGSLQAHLMRLDALGDRLVTVGKLDEDEFDFDAQPPVGGVEELLPGENSVADLSQEMQRIAGILKDRDDKLSALEQLLMNRGLMAEVMPSGKPVKKGWLSSSYGKRTDPFTGKKSLHRGVDFAGKPGSDVIAVASGVVTRSERVSGYGNIVEVRHAEGYATRYAHNQENLVAVGDVVSKGDTIALLGSTGRSSGPHVHFEVHRHGKVVNPSRFLRQP